MSIAPMLRLYLDTSVVSAYFDVRTPERQADTTAFFDRKSEYSFFISELTLQELERTRDQGRRDEMNALLAGIPSIKITTDMELLGQRYIAAGIFSSKQQEDALHVAVAVIYGLDVLVSWNYRHLVNRRRRAMVLAVNAAQGYPSIEIISPPEV